MKYFEVVFHAIPTLTFAHTYETEDYNLHFPANTDYMEITYIERGDLTYFYENGETNLLPEKSVCSFYRREKSRGRSNGAFHRHITVGIGGPLEVREVDKSEIVSRYKEFFFDAPKRIVAIVPQKLERLAESDAAKQIIARLIADKSRYPLGCTALIFELFSVLTKAAVAECLTSADSDITFSGSRYCTKAIAYMSANPSRKMSAGEIARAVGISREYLSRIFRSVTGCSVVEYQNRLKIDAAKELIRTKNIDNSEAAAQVGINDEKYFCRLFKKHAGMTVGQYKKSIQERASL